jgi:phosphohistidine phosphatase
MQQQGQYIAQAAAIPFRVNAEGKGKSRRVEVLLIRRRDKSKWGIPKGLVDAGFTHRQAAANEAREEAGIKGVVSNKALGSFTYEKFGGTCLVEVYPMRVTAVLPHWDEEGYRVRQWFEIRDAAGQVSRDDVGKLIARLARTLARE